MTLELFPAHDRVLVSPVSGEKASKSGILLPDAYMNYYEIMSIGDTCQALSPFQEGDTVALNGTVDELAEKGYMGHKIKLDKNDAHFTHVIAVPLNEIAFVIRNV